MSTPSEAEVPQEKEVAPSGLLQRLRTAKWAPRLRKHLAQETVLTAPPGVECGGEDDPGAGDAGGDGD